MVTLNPLYYYENTRSFQFLTQFGSEWRKSWLKLLFWRFEKFLGLLNMFTAKIFQKEALLYIDISASFGVDNFRKPWLMRVIFSTHHWKFHLYTKNAKNISQKVYSFFDNVIWVGNGRLSLLPREYSRLTVRLLTSSPKIWYLIIKKFF